MDSHSLTPFFALPFLLLYAGFLVLYIWSVVWCYGDANARGKPGCLVAILVAFFSWPIGLLLWVIFRPEQNRPRY